MQFDFIPLRFEFVAHDPLYMPPGKAGNILRGAFGSVLRRTTCPPECEHVRSCVNWQDCPYARVFEPIRRGAGPSGLEQHPRPFVFRARHLETCTIERGQPFHFDVHILSSNPELPRFFIRTFAELGFEGFGPRRSKAELQSVRRFGPGDPSGVVCASNENGMRSVAPVSIDLDGQCRTVNAIRIDFLSPTELKYKNQVVKRPDFSILFARIRDRINSLRTLYGGGPLNIDLCSGRRSEAIEMTDCAIGTRHVTRKSGRTGQVHSIGGFIGCAVYRGELAEFLPYLETARWAGVGRHASWGNGEIAIHADV